MMLKTIIADENFYKTGEMLVITFGIVLVQVSNFVQLS